MSVFGCGAACLGLWAISACAPAALPPQAGAERSRAEARQPIAARASGPDLPRKATAASPSASASAGAAVQTSAAPVVEPRVASTVTPPKSGPSIRLHAEGPLAEWAFEATGFPALAEDGEHVVVAFGAQGTSGPPSLTLGLEIQSVDGASTRRARFDEPYRGELSLSALARLRRRAEAWALQQNKWIARQGLEPLARVFENDQANCSDEGTAGQRIVAESIEARLSKGRLTITTRAMTTLHDRAHPEWTVHGRAPDGSCVYEPRLASMALDSARRLLLVRVEHCTPGDQCTADIPPNFLLLRVH